MVKLLCALWVLWWRSALADVHYVDVNSTNATPPYSSWSTAATNIQDAVDAAVAGDEIVVTNGTYRPVSVNQPLSVRSVNGPQFTIINGGGSVRCATLHGGGSLFGFTLTNGYGGGAYGGTLNNCVITGNRVLGYGGIGGFPAVGGGVYGCTLNNCTLNGNSASADVSNGFFANAIAQGGGAAFSRLNNCTLSGNSALVTISQSSFRSRITARGGGAYSCTLNNCTLSGNSATANCYNDPDPEFIAHGGGAYQSTLNNCTLIGNSVNSEFGDIPFYSESSGGGAESCDLGNCIVYFNTNNFGGGFEVYEDDSGYFSSLNHCYTPEYDGIGNITNAPLFVNTNGWANLRLQSNSPCINAGLNAFAPTGPDLDGNPRIVGGTVDVGAYEFQSLDLVGFGVVSNQFGFNITGQSNWVIVLEASSNFTNWTALTTNTLNGSPFPFRDPTPPNLPQRFYRARQELP